MRMGGDGDERRRSGRRGSAERRLAELIRDLGEERFRAAASPAPSRGARQAAPISRTGELAEIVRAAIPHREPGLDPATRTFQALRIAVNDELGELDRGLAAAERMLMPGGRLAVVAFHSLEDGAGQEFPAAAQRRERPARRATPRRARPAGRRASRCCRAGRSNRATPRPRQSARPLGPAARRRADRGAALPAIAGAGRR